MEKGASLIVNLVIVAIVLIVVLFGGYTYLNRDTQVESELNSLSQVQVVDSNNDMVKMLSDLKKVNLNYDFSADNSFYQNMILKDRVLSPQNKGRHNPFAPIGTGSPFSTTTSTTTIVDTTN